MKKADVQRIIVYTMFFITVAVMIYGAYHLIHYLVVSSRSFYPIKDPDRMRPLQLVSLTVALLCYTYVFIDIFNNDKKVTKINTKYPEYRSLFLVISIFTMIGTLFLFILIFIFNLIGSSPFEEFHSVAFFVGFFDASLLYLSIIVFMALYRVKSKSLSSGKGT